MKRLGLALTPAIVSIVGIWFAPTAWAGGTVYWANLYSGTISHASLNGSGGGQLNTGSAHIYGPDGLALDPITGWVYWANDTTSKTDAMAWANLDNTGGGVNVTVTGPGSADYVWGLATVPAASKLYWASYYDSQIATSNLDGGGSSNLSTPGVTPDYPSGVAVDPALGKIFWTNNGDSTIGWAYLNGSGGADLNTGTAPIFGPAGLAIDPKNNRIYWANYDGGAGTSIGWANLNGSGGGQLNTSGATVNAPIGVAVDPVSGRVYWANYAGGASGGPISSASVNGGGGANLSTPGAGGGGEVWPSLLFPPKSTHRPKLAGGKKTGSKLRCSQGKWAGDMVEAFYYQSVETYSYSWSRNGHHIKNATNHTYKARKAGAYKCAVTATNAAGSTRATSRVHRVKHK